MRLWDEVRYQLLSRRHKEAVDMAFEALRAQTHGRWKGAGMGDYRCSLCSEVVSGNNHNYCPNCGARMEGVSDAEE